jgi:hypothetical protein
MRGSPSRAINRGSLTFTRPVFPSPTPPGWNQRRFDAPPELRTPPSPATHVRGRDRPSSTDLELPLNSHPSISNPVVHSIRATSRRTAKTRCAARRGPRRAFTSARVSRGVVPSPVVSGSESAAIAVPKPAPVSRNQGLLAMRRSCSGDDGRRFAHGLSQNAAWRRRSRPRMPGGADQGPVATKPPVEGARMLASCP